MLLIYGECRRKAKSAARLYRERFPHGLHPTRQTNLKVVKRLRETGCVTNRPRVSRPRNLGRKVQTEDVLAYAIAHSQSSTKMISENCGLSKSRVWTILNESGAHPYRPTPVKGLLLRDAKRRHTWCNFVVNNFEDHSIFLADIIWTYEACFSRNGMYNRQNVHTWSPENPRYALEGRHQPRWSINVWCGIFNDRFIGPVFYEGTLTGQRYLELLQDVIIDFLENLPLHQLRNVWFQHDGAPPYKISNVKQYLMEIFQSLVMVWMVPRYGYGGFVKWPPRSPDLTPLDFFLSGHIKGQVYATPPPTLQDFRRRITDTCASVTPVMLHNAQREILSRVQICIVANGEHFEQYK
ncbi:hypothetical protein AVEN_185408-1 [Araneus ventricosus]|uniref:DUF4817 domain-containing protein n=1 Tax=Araneus ventricosus TaxID=182803 RepID=A0A4Y2CHS7_ARAVE|nr:hypothetical protein AVEN_185408-1 [Araneus ventricosus]